MPTNYNGGQTPLEIAAIAAREKLIPKNTYNNFDDANQYSAKHTRAISDKTTPVNGKGSGGELDIENYSGVGGDLDINGNQATATGSGRLAQLGLNNAVWGYGPNGLGMEGYKKPNMDGNKGQVVI